MDIRAQLEKAHSRANAQAIADHVGDDKARFAVLMDCMLEGTFQVAQRAAFSVGIACERHPHLAAPYVGRLLDMLEAPVHEAVKRNSLRIMQFCELPETLHGRIADLLFALVADPMRSIAQRAFAITVAMRMVQLYPELAGEFRTILEVVMRSGPSPAIRVRCRYAAEKLDSGGRGSRQKGGGGRQP